MSILTHGELQLLLIAIEQRTGIRHRPDQLETVGKTITKVMREAGIEETGEFLIALDSNDSVFNSLVEAITIGETYFFREPKHFEFIRDHVVPDFRKRFGEHAQLRAWSSACSSGEEAYSLAILCQEMHQSADILATDIAPDSINQARRATYRDWSFRGESFNRVQPFLMPDRTDNQHTLIPAIRRRVRFGLLNLATDQYPESKLGTTFLNLIFCRNVLIYFDKNTSQRIAMQLARCLASGGWLIAASADPSLDSIPGLKAVTNEWGVFYQRYPATPHTPSPRQSTERTLQPPLPHRQEKTVEEFRTAVEGNRLNPKQAEPDPKTTCKTPAAGSICQQLTSLRQFDIPTALEKVADLVESHPLEVPVHYSHGRLLLESGQLLEAAKAVQKALFLDQSAIMPHFLFGTIEIRRGQWQSADRHLRSARELCRQLDPRESVPLSDEMTAAETLAAIDSQIARVPEQPG